MSTNTKKCSRWAVLALAAVAVGAGLAGCDRLLSVTAPGQIPTEKLNDPGLSEMLVNSVIADFECAYDNYTFGASTQSDEMWQSSGNLEMRNWGDRKITADFDNYVNGSCGGAGFGLWRTLHAARYQAETNFKLVSDFPDSVVADKAAKLATIMVYGAYVYTFLGETFCQVTVDGGSPMDPPAVLAIADDHFTQAIQLAQQANDTDILDLAFVGRARTRLDLKRYANARADAAQVPQGFEFYATRSPDVPSRFNKARTQFDEGGHETVAAGFRNLTWKGVPDPRTNVYDAGRLGFDGVSELWLSDKYPDRGSPIRLASWEEAQLIIAEAAANTGDDATAVSIINELHAQNGLPAYDPVSDGPVMQHIIQERSRELFQQGGQRLNDMLRFNLPFFTGKDQVGQDYGTTTCFPLPAVEGVGSGG